MRNQKASRDHVQRLIEIARATAARDSEFQAIRGPGDGDRATRAFMMELRDQAKKAFKKDYSECKICGNNSFAVDFYVPEEQTIVEVALGLPNPASEFEKDVLKAIMAQEEGQKVRRLVFISRPGGKTKCMQPGRSDIRAWALKKHRLDIEVYDLDGEPRARRRIRRVSVL